MLSPLSNSFPIFILYDISYAIACITIFKSVHFVLIFFFYLILAKEHLLVMRVFTLRSLQVFLCKYAACRPK